MAPVNYNTLYSISKDAHVNTIISSLNDWIHWDDGITFNGVFWMITLVFVLLGIHLLRLKVKFTPERFAGTYSSPPDIKPATSTWKDWLTFKINEEVVGRDGSSYLWFSYRLFKIQGLVMVLAIALMIINSYGGRLDEGPVMTFRSTTMDNYIPRAYHLFCYAIFLFFLVHQMKNHGTERQIRSVVSDEVVQNSASNRLCLMISRLPLDIKKRSLYRYLKSKINLKEVYYQNITMARDVSQLLSIGDDLKYIWEVKKNLIHRRLSDPITQNFDVWLDYLDKENILLDRRRKLIRDIEFVGTVFIKFDYLADVKAARKILEKYQHQRYDSDQDKRFKPSQWNIRYAPPSSDINWKQMRKPLSIWENLLKFFTCLVVSSFYIILVTLPDILVQWLHLEGNGLNQVSPFWKSFMLPTIGSLFATKLTNLVTQLYHYRRNSTVTRTMQTSLRSNCYLLIILYLIRMIAIKPFPFLLSEEFPCKFPEFRWNCFSIFTYGSFITCAIIVNTASCILRHHTRVKYFFSYMKEWLFFRVEAEKESFKKTFTCHFDYSCNYAELASNFVLTTLVLPFFPVIGIVAWFCSIVRFWSERSALMTIYPTTTRVGHDVHMEPVNIVTRMSIATPIALFLYLWIGNYGKIVVESIDQLLVILMVGLLTIHAHSKLFSYSPDWLRRLKRLRNSAQEEKNDQEDFVRSRNLLENEYDPTANLNKRARSYSSV